MKQIFVPPASSPFAPRGGTKATRPRRNGSGRQPFLALTEPQKLQLESSLFGAGAAVFAALCGVIAMEPEQTTFTVCAFGVFATISVWCCSGVVACFAALNAWEDDVTRVTRHLKDGMDLWRERFESSARGAETGSGSRGHMEPLPAQVIRFPGDWRA